MVGFVFWGWQCHSQSITCLKGPSGLPLGRTASNMKTIQHPVPGGQGVNPETAMPVVPVAPFAVAEPASEPYIGKTEVAARLGRTTRGVNQLMRRRKIPFYKFDRRPAFRWSEVQAHLAQTSHISPAPADPATDSAQRSHFPSNKHQQTKNITS